MIQSIEFQGDDALTLPEILERFRQRKIKLRAETHYREDEIERAAETVQELLAERGRRNRIVVPSVEPIAPASVKIIFKVEDKQ